MLIDVGLNGMDDGGSNEQMSHYRGYTVWSASTAEAIIALLGEPPLKEEESIEDRIPPGADDWAIRLPVPQADWPAIPAAEE